MSTKRETLEKLLEEGLVQVMLDPRVEGVVVPAHLQRQLPLALNLSHNFHLDVFEIDDEGVRASLSFKGERTLCVLPWPAIFSLSTPERPHAHVFPESVPETLRAALEAAVREAEEAPDSEVPPPPPPPRGRPQLRIVK